MTADGHGPSLMSHVDTAAFGVPECASWPEEDAHTLLALYELSALSAPTSGPIPLLIASAAHDEILSVEAPDSASR
jgi:hypothetical protein